MLVGRRLRELAREAIETANTIDDPIPYRERYVLLALANELKDNPGETWTSDARIAEKVGMSPDAYYRARTRLVKWGYMQRVSGSGQGSSMNRYRLLPTFADPAQPSSADSAELEDAAPQPASADTQTASADTDTTSADPPRSSAPPADITPSSPYEPREQPTPYGAPPAQLLPTIDNEQDLETERQRQLRALAEMTHAAR